MLRFGFFSLLSIAVFGISMISLSVEAEAQSATQPAQDFKSLDILQKHYEERIERMRDAIERQRLASLKELMKQVNGDASEPIMRAMIDSAKFLEDYKLVLSLTDRYLEAHPKAAAVSGVRQERILAMIELGNLDQARQAWAKTLPDMDMNIWQQVFETGLIVAEGYLLEGDVKGAQSIYDSMRKHFSFVTNLADVLTGLEAELKWIGKEPADIVGTTMRGKKVALDSYKGKPVLIDFWATWCPGCIEELPALKEIYAEYHDKGFEIIGISVDDDLGAVERFVERVGIPWPIVAEGKGWGSANVRAYRVMSIPQTFLISPDGKIARVRVQKDALRAHLDHWLKDN